MTDDHIIAIRLALKRDVSPTNDDARALCDVALQANAWTRWARVAFIVPDKVSDGELRQWIGERLSSGDLSIVRLGEGDP